MLVGESKARDEEHEVFSVSICQYCHHIPMALFLERCGTFGGKNPEAMF